MRAKLESKGSLENSIKWRENETFFFPSSASTVTEKEKKLFHHLGWQDVRETDAESLMLFSSHLCARVSRDEHENHWAEQTNRKEKGMKGRESNLCRYLATDSSTFSLSLSLIGIPRQGEIKQWRIKNDKTRLHVSLDRCVESKSKFMRNKQKSVLLGLWNSLQYLFTINRVNFPVLVCLHGQILRVRPD